MKRRAPDCRRVDMERRDQEQFEDWVVKDTIDSFDDFVNKFRDHMKDLKQWIIHSTDDKICLLIIDCVKFPKVTTAIVISNNMNFEIFLNDLKLSDQSLECILGRECKLTCWTQLSTLLSHYCNGESILMVNNLIGCISLAFDRLCSLIDESEQYDENILFR